MADEGATHAQLVNAEMGLPLGHLKAHPRKFTRKRWSRNHHAQYRANQRALKRSLTRNLSPQSHILKAQSQKTCLARRGTGCWMWRRGPLV
jgi:hypothetical protein